MPKRALAVLGLVFTCASAAQTPIAIETLFRRPDYGSMQLSPDATKLATVMVSHGRYNLAIIDLATRQARAITAFDDADVVRYVWIGGGRLLLDLGEMHDASGRERISSAVAVDADGGVQYRTRFASSSVLYRFFDSGDVIVSARGPGRDDTQAWRASTRSNERTLLTGDNPGHVGRWIVDQAGNVRVAIGYDRAERQQVFHHRSDVGAPWKEFARFNIASRENFVPLGFDFDGKTLFVTSNIGADRRAIYRYDPETGKFLDKLLESARVDVTNLIVDRHAKRVIGAYSDEADAGDIWLDAQLQRVQNGVNQALPGLRNRLSSGSLNRTRMLITSSSDVQPAKYWLLDVESGRLEELASSRKWIDSKIMTPAKRMSYKSRDGLDIPAAMMVPATASGHKPPLVVMIHGGPNASGYGHGFNEEAQFFASRGYAVLMPDFRGTTGYGRSFVEAGDRQWGRAMQDDITDGVRWAIDQGIVDAERVCLFGWSYGGYAALMGLVREPPMFRCAVAAVAVTDPALLFDVGWNRAAAIDEFEEDLDRRIGDPKDQAELEAISPLKQAKRIKAPVLLAFGGVDRRVPIVHGTRMKNALEENGTPVEWVMYPTEAHGFNKDENRFDFYRRVEKFLAQHLVAP